MSSNSPFEYSDEQMDEMFEALESIPSAVVDGKVMVTVDLVSKIAGILMYNMEELSKHGMICEAEAMHTMITADYIQKIAGSIKLKHSDALVPDNITELLDIPEE